MSDRCNSSQNTPDFAASLRRLYWRLREAVAHRRQRRDLAELDDRLLSDVGLGTLKLDEKTGGPAWK